MTTTEAEWDAETRDLALALDAVPTCPVCGRDPKVCQDPDKAYDWRVPDPTRCHAHTALLERQKLVDDETNPHSEALTWRTYLDSGDQAAIAAVLADATGGATT